MSFYTDIQRQCVEEWFAGKGNLRAQGLDHRLKKALAKRTNLSLLHCNSILKDLIKDGLITSSSGLHNRGTITSEIPAPVPESQQRWIQVLQKVPESSVLLPCHEDLEDWCIDDMERLLICLLDLKAARPEAYQLSKYEASARYLLGSSKLLDSLDKKSLMLFGIDLDQFQTSITYAVIAGPEKPEHVLLIENPQSFEACIRAGLHEQQTLICTYGYGLQWSQVLENPKSVTGLIRAGNPNQNLQALLSHSDIYFWGDLDHAGIDIFQSIAKRVPTCKLSNLYLPMIEALKAGQGHPYTKAVKKEEQPLRNPIHGLSAAIDQEQFNNIATLTRYSQSGMTLQEFQAQLSR
ncbi:Wadjet anti-phage system protein JetD domain-containing protein [Endozoicomonas ascidiicola]|uniref:Wadjet anti-phage system protein JetD domain-containing protein n=1 Tax=Endozoicomonas ascidiicola TaxID=1698521 RepID=UPI00082AB1EB|nr:Wadjet anti-phage system protein JetD domain-containing protein [Endozoicomonas ascidiicola]